MGTVTLRPAARDLLAEAAQAVVECGNNGGSVKAVNLTGLFELEEPGLSDLLYTTFRQQVEELSADALTVRLVNPQLFKVTPVGAGLLNMVLCEAPRRSTAMVGRLSESMRLLRLTKTRGGVQLEPELKRK